MSLGCNRSGGCCETIILEYSPKQLREDYHKWATSDSTGYTVQDIWLIYPMTAGRCRGKRLYEGGAVRYVYGPCRNLGYEGGLATCAIQADKPRLCSGYPFYGDAPTDNPGYIRGCGYNIDKSIGLDGKGLAVIPLDASEI